MRALARDDLSRALVEFWCALGAHESGTTRRFADWERLAAEHELHDARIAEFEDSLTAKTFNPARPIQDPLALFQAIDRALRHCTAGFGDDRRPHSVRKQSFLVVRKRRADDSRARRNAQSPHRWLRHHWVVPTRIGGTSVRIEPQSRTLANRLETRRDRPLRIAIAAFTDDARYDVRDGLVFFADRSHAAKRKQSLRAVIEWATRDTSIDILVLPELTVPEELRDEMSAQLESNPGIALAVLGSCHRGSGNDVTNRALLLDSIGTELIVHDKLLRFNSPGGDPFEENIRIGESIAMLDTAIGLIALCICKDFCEVIDPPAIPWQRLAPDWMLVPSMGVESTLHAHDRAARNLHLAHASVTAVANQPPGGPATDAICGFIFHGQREALAEIQPNERKDGSGFIAQVTEIPT